MIPDVPEPTTTSAQSGPQKAGVLGLIEYYIESFVKHYVTALYWPVGPHVFLTFSIVWLMAQINMSYGAGAILIYLYFSNLIPQRIRREADEITVANDHQRHLTHRVTAKQKPKDEAVAETAGQQQVTGDIGDNNQDWRGSTSKENFKASIHKVSDKVSGTAAFVGGKAVGTATYVGGKAVGTATYVGGKAVDTAAYTVDKLTLGKVQMKKKKSADVALSEDKNAESAEWVNTLLKRFWPDLLEPMLNQIIKDNVQYYLDLYRPAMVSRLEMHTFELGKRPLEIKLAKASLLDGAKVPMRAANIPWDKVWDQPEAPEDPTAVQLELQVQCRLKAKVELLVGFPAVPNITVLAEGVDFDGHLILQLLDISDSAIGGLRIGFKEQPRLSIRKLTPMGSISLINLSKLDFLTKTIDDILDNLMVKNSIDVDLKAVPPPPKPVVRLDIHVKCAQNLVPCDTALTIKGLKKSSDPFVKLTVDGQMRRTCVVKKSLNPHWDESFTFLFDKARWDRLSPDPVTLTLTVMDEDTLISNDFLGDAEVDIRPLLGKCVQGWINLQNATSGRVRVDFKLYDALANTDYSGKHVETVDKLNLELVDVADVMGSKMVTVKGMVDSAAGLKRMNMLTGGSDPLVRLQLCDKKHTTRHVSNQLNPVFKEVFHFVLHAKAFDEKPVLSINLSDYEKVGLNKPMGSAELDLSKFLHGNEVTQVVPLDTQGTVTLHLYVDHPDHRTEQGVEASTSRAVDFSGAAEEGPAPKRALFLSKSIKKGAGGDRGFDELDIDLMINEVVWDHPARNRSKMMVKVEGFGQMGRLVTRLAEPPYVWKQQFHQTIQASDVNYLRPVTLSVKSKGVFSDRPLGDATLTVGLLVDEMDLDKSGRAKRDLSLDLANIVADGGGKLSVTLGLVGRKVNGKAEAKGELMTGMLKVKFRNYGMRTVKQYFVVTQRRSINIFLPPSDADPLTFNLDSFDDKTKRAGSFPLDMSTEVALYSTKQTSVGRFGIKITTRGQTLKMGADTDYNRTQWVTALKAHLSSLFQAYAG
eukprot:CAMPEP_0118924840 /NCGR_PEP_ID=MMETSP1169-20130426/2789_1 /TAXON_ID=36882 /ORGANISM="Pyramimonas obovata, Strain CCMP722" /LENGTH=1035 /DNA_ID=CAMNT_0006865979 /DNA_START=183 /DNA_END=3290 /DNA_ORIENTATION=+